MSKIKNSTIAIALLFAIAFAGYAPAAHAQTPNASAVASLYAQIAALQAQLAAMKGSATGKVKGVSSEAPESEVEITKVTTSKRPTISGTAEEAAKLYVTVTKDGASKPTFKKSVKVSKDKWSTRISKNLSNGTYTVDVYASQKDDEALDSTSITVGKRGSSTKDDAKSGTVSSGTFSVSLVPLLMGGTARSGQASAISYLKVVNTGKETATLSGVTLSQKGSAPSSAIARITIKDDKDGSQGETAVSGTTTTVPTTSVFAPGEMKLFTIKAVLAGNASAHLGKTLQYEVTGVTGGKGAFPIKGTTLTIGL